MKAIFIGVLTAAALATAAPALADVHHDDHGRTVAVTHGHMAPRAMHRMHRVCRVVRHRSVCSMMRY